jgi:hypothetical protein
MEDACLSDGEAADLLPVYRRELRRETGRPAEAADAS